MIFLTKARNNRNNYRSSTRSSTIIKMFRLQWHYCQNAAEGFKTVRAINASQRQHRIWKISWISDCWSSKFINCQENKQLNGKAYNQSICLWKLHTITVSQRKSLFTTCRFISNSKSANYMQILLTSAVNTAHAIVLHISLHATEFHFRRQYVRCSHRC